MNMVQLEFSIVVVGEDCNPTILNPDFLRVQGIVPEDWGWELAGPPITTPALSILPYSSRVMIKVEPKRFQVTDGAGAENVAESKAVHIARRYIDVLPHVRYTAVGTNFLGFVAMDEPNEFLKNRFIKPGPWNQQRNPLKDVGLSFIYVHDDAQLTVSLASKVLLEEQDDKKFEVVGLDVSANYHRACKGYPTDKQVLSYIDRLPDDASHLKTITSELLFKND